MTICRLKDELQKMQYLYNDHISGVKIEVQKLYSVKVKIIARLIFVTTIIHFRKKNWTS